MKAFHPTAHVRSSDGRIVGMVLDNISDKNGPATVVTMPQFTNLVFEDKVQFFQGTPNGVVVEYTPEELKYLKSKRKTPLLGDDYFNSGVCFFEYDISCINQDVNGVYTAISAIMSMSVLGQVRTIFWLFRGRNYDKAEFNAMRKALSGANISQIASNIILVISNPDKLVEYFTSRQIPFGVCMHPHDNVDNIYYKAKMPGARPASKGDILLTSKKLMRTRLLPL